MSDIVNIAPIIGITTTGDVAIDVLMLISTTNATNIKRNIITKNTITIIPIDTISIMVNAISIIVSATSTITVKISSTTSGTGAITPMWVKCHLILGWMKLNLNQFLVNCLMM